MGERSLILRVALVLVSLLFQFVGLLAFFGYGLFLVLNFAGVSQQNTRVPTLGEAIVPILLGLLLFLLGRASWKAQKRLGAYYKAYRKKLKASGEEDLASIVPFYGSHEYFLIYDYTNVFVDTLMKQVGRLQEQSSPIQIEEMGRREITGLPVSAVRKLPEGFLIAGRWKGQSGTIFNLNDKANHVIKGRAAVTTLFHSLRLPPLLATLSTILYFIPLHEQWIYQWFLREKMKSPTTPLNVKV